MSITRKLNSRERRRLQAYGMIPVDALDPACSSRELIENNTTHLYRYGCYLEDTNVELEEFIAIRNRRKSSTSFFHLRGFIINTFPYPLHISFDSLFHTHTDHFWSRLWLGISSSISKLLLSPFYKDSFDEENCFIFEPIFMVLFLLLPHHHRNYK